MIILRLETLSVSSGIIQESDRNYSIFLPGMAADFFLAGIDTTTYTTSFLLYHLSSNPRVQEKLFGECLKVLPEVNSNISESALQEIPFARAILKESLRLNPVSVGVGRLLAKDSLLSGFVVPQGVSGINGSDRELSDT